LLPTALVEIERGTRWVEFYAPPRGGGEASYRTQDAAIALAKELGDELCFRYVVDLHFLDKTVEPIVVDVGTERVKMGDFLLVMAKERAAAQGINAQTIVRQGQIRKEMAAAARQMGATLIVLGRPAGPTAHFDENALQSFADSLRTETGVDVYILDRQVT
jgi:nucleotide-binding universal stress UspA family protein